MKQVSLLVVLGLCGGLAACGAVPAIYGVPETQWQGMSETERQAAIQRFQEQEALHARTREASEAARREAAKSEAETERACEDPEQALPNQDACKRRTLYRDVWP